MLLSQLRERLILCRSAHFRDVRVAKLTADSRNVSPGSLFVALRGYTVDGHTFAKAAVESGAAALLVEEALDIAIPQLIVPDTRLASAILADAFYEHPSHRVKVIGVTGTNGKTTTTHLIDKILTDAGKSTGLLGTIGNRIGGHVMEAVNTTPEAIELQSIFREMASAGCEYGIMEVSSHALELRRTAGTRFHTAVFTNLTRDHLDFHKTMENYRAAKAKLFSGLGNDYSENSSLIGHGVVNVDDEAGLAMARETVVECLTYGIENEAHVRAVDIQLSAKGVSFRIDSFLGSAEVHMHLPGRFNVYNALAATAVGLIERIPIQQIASSLSEVPGIPGRFEPVSNGQPFTVLVDYSHTPDSLENALNTIREFARGKVITVVGCGGDRDRTKRPMMAAIAEKHSDFAIFTSDNPRTEDADAILDEMETGVGRASSETWRRILDREEAIDYAVRMAKQDDVILIAGKGHETYQIIGRTKHHFDDREVASAAIARLLKNER